MRRSLRLGGRRWWQALASQGRRAVVLLRSQGVGALGPRVVRRIYQASRAAELEFPLLPGDVADSTRLAVVAPSDRIPDAQKLRIGWLMTPPGPGSGGHTTIFRMVAALEQAGHECELILYDRFKGDLLRHEKIIRRSWPWIRAMVRDVDAVGLAPDVCLATSWQTAHVLARRPWVTRRMYFVQDFEPFFYPRGSEYALAEDSYRFGFPVVSIGHMVADVLRSELNVAADIAPFGVDSSIYHMSNHGPRNGVVFYTKPDVPRRGYFLGVAALAEFHRRMPEQQIHVFGDEVRGLPFPVVQHHRLTPPGLNELYNRTRAGMAMSFTNISLVAEEMLAAGTIPVVNDSIFARADLPNTHVMWARATAGGLADGLCAVVSRKNAEECAAIAASSVRGDGWAPAGAVVLRAVERLAYGQ